MSDKPRYCHKCKAWHSPTDAGWKTGCVSELPAPACSPTGPSYCAVCGEWPAHQTPRGLRCNLCDDQEWAAAHPVPLPNNPAMLRDLASIGVPGAAEKLANAAHKPCGD